MEQKYFVEEQDEHRADDGRHSTNIWKLSMGAETRRQDKITGC